MQCRVLLSSRIIVADAGLVRRWPVLCRRHWPLSTDTVRTGLLLREWRGLYRARRDGRSRYRLFLPLDYAVAYQLSLAFMLIFFKQYW